MSKASTSTEEDVDGWRVSVSAPHFGGTTLIQETSPRAAALRALSEALERLGRKSAQPGWVVFCQHTRTGESGTLQTWTFETNDQGELSEGTSRQHRPKVEGTLDLDEARVEGLMAVLKPLVARSGRAALSHWMLLDRASGNTIEPETAEAHRRLLEAMGGPPGPEEMRAWLDRTLAARDSGSADIATPDTIRPGPHLRQAACPHCAAVTTQTRHGQALSGRLWKGHLCTCQGWECRGCGVVLEPKAECCR